MGSNEKVVTKPIKVDLHIHSSFSITKDSSDIVGEGTIENLSKLVGKLNNHHINLASITDHDYFSFDMYKEFKSFEGKGELKKVLPGVEFSVGIQNENKKFKQVHIIAIFDDSSDDKLKRIETEILKLENGKVKYDNKVGQFFTENKLFEILKDIGLNTILIAHQKNSTTSTTASEPDLSSIGERRFNEFLMSEVFEALEFKSMRNGLFNNLFALKMNSEVNYDVVKFITGSDCHQWDVYPAHDINEVQYIDEYKPTFLKCLPTFKGLTMALSDYSRIQLGDSFFSCDDSKLESIQLEIDGIDKLIPLSPGINAIIGDNSIGKSLLLHKLTDYSEIKDDKIIAGYNEYLSENKILINSVIEKQKLYYFDYQGNIRKRFEKKDDSKNQEFLTSKFPVDPVKSIYINIIDDYFNNLYTRLKAKFDYDAEYAKLMTLVLTNNDASSKVISITALSNNKSDITNYSNIKSYLTDIQVKINDPQKYNKLEKEDVALIDEFKQHLAGLINKYDNYLRMEKYHYKIKNGINLGMSSFKSAMKVFKDQSTQIKEKFDSDCAEVGNIISTLLILRKEIKEFSFDVKEKIEIMPSTLNYNGYNFIRRFKNARVINNDYLNSILSSCLKGSKIINTSTITEEELANALKDYSRNTKKPLEFLKERINDKIMMDFEVESVILKANQNEYDNLSHGLNATLYFDIISGDSKRGIYLIDQPEDDVSQNAIKTNIIKDFKKMAQSRQILLITHNPQFVVNLDVDNVICIYKDRNNHLEISSGALEYEDLESKTNIIQLVADNLDGGVDSIRKRWKRYEKEFSTN